MPNDAEIRSAVDELFRRLKVLRDDRSEEAVVNILAAAGRMKELGFNPIVFRKFKGVEGYSTRFAAPEIALSGTLRNVLVDKVADNVEELTPKAERKVKLRFTCDVDGSDATNYCTECDFMGCSTHYYNHMREKHGDGHQNPAVSAGF